MIHLSKILVRNFHGSHDSQNVLGIWQDLARVAKMLAKGVLFCFSPGGNIPRGKIFPGGKYSPGVRIFFFKQIGGGHHLFV